MHQKVFLSPQLDNMDVYIVLPDIEVENKSWYQKEQVIIGVILEAYKVLIMFLIRLSLLSRITQYQGRLALGALGGGLGSVGLWGILFWLRIVVSEF